MRIRIFTVDGLLLSVSRHTVQIPHQRPHFYKTLPLNLVTCPSFHFTRPFTSSSTNFAKMKFVGAIDQVGFRNAKSDCRVPRLQGSSSSMRKANLLRLIKKSSRKFKNIQGNLFPLHPVLTSKAGSNTIPLKL